MNILHISGARSWGGSEQQLLYLMNELPKYNVSQKLLCYKDTPLHMGCSQISENVIAIPYLKPTSSEYRQKLKSVIDENQIDIIHIHTNDALTGYILTDLFYNLKTRTILSRKSVRSSHSILSRLKYNYRNIDGIICVSKYVEKHFSRILTEKNRGKTIVVHDSVKENEEKPTKSFNIREKYNLSEDCFLIGNIANHTKAKDHPLLIKTLKELVKVRKLENIKLIQIGQFTALTEELKSLVQKNGLEDYIIYTDFVKDASELMDQFDVFLMTSKREGGPSSVIEAFSKKVPVVSTRVGVVEEAIEDGVNGFSSPVNDFHQLAQKLIALKENNSLREQFKQKSYDRFISDFTADKLGKETFMAYESLIKSGSIKSFQKN
ncbi:glycosyltransferase family 4 protein [Gramella sp. GC03-9]|uniref:Glycosyltransferase family 4 protein n=1 Tax=Christiangramia oceanisediminis TaxID=2920386 RepID=A0A9X2KZG2_9FLAO|nr:glycosyltransferase family 4 protein [Gramella oceanisediminis]MCP9201087.1 glycosyltransferase family 4 protein [Gramella oceanisediminis]